MIMVSTLSEFRDWKPAAAYHTNAVSREGIMYIPTAFHETDQAKLFEFVEQNSFGLLVSQADEPFATHLPFLLDRSRGPHGTLIGHLAKANPQWQQADGQKVLAVFSGPHAYISPTWYEADNVVPTWNYVAVHAYGTFRVIENQDILSGILRDFVARYEALLPRPWSFDPASDFAIKMMKAVVGFQVEITRIEGKWKLNQNRPAEQRERVMSVLRTFSDENSQAIADLIVQRS
jgi:transcriptional regulator